MLSYNQRERSLHSEMVAADSLNGCSCLALLPTPFSRPEPLKTPLILYFLLGWAFPLSILEIRMTKSNRGLPKPGIPNAEKRNELNLIERHRLGDDTTQTIYYR